MKFEIPEEVADGITRKSLEDHYQMSKERLDKWYDGEQWMHRDDIDEEVILMQHLKAIIEYFGGSV